MLGLHKSTVIWGLLSPTILSRLISTKKYIVVAETYTNLNKMDKLERNLMEQYLYSCNSEKSAGILTSEEDIVLDGYPERWPIFHLELNGVLTKFGLWSVTFNKSGAGGGTTHTKLFFQEIWIGRFLKLTANKTTLQWPMGKGVIYGISLWGCMKVRYDTTTKL